MEKHIRLELGTPSKTMSKHHLRQAPSPAEHDTNTSKPSLLSRVAITFAAQTVYLGVALVALNWYHGKYDLTLNVSHIPWWHLFLCFGAANICAQVALSKAGVEHIL